MLCFRPLKTTFRRLFGEGISLSHIRDEARAWLGICWWMWVSASRPPPNHRKGRLDFSGAPTDHAAVYEQNMLRHSCATVPHVRMKIEISGTFGHRSENPIKYLKNLH